MRTREATRVLFGTAVAAALLTSAIAGTAAAAPTPYASIADETITTLIGSGRSEVGKPRANDPDDVEQGDDVPPRELDLDSPSSVAVGSDGTIYVADLQDDNIRALSPDRRTIRTVAGVTGAVAATDADKGDGGPATKAILDGPAGLAVGPGRTLYFVDHLGTESSVRAIDLRRGTIRTVPGSFGGPSDLAVDRHGSLYVADASGSRVCRVDGGRCETVARTGEFEMSIAVGPDGTVYVALPARGRVLAIHPKSGKTSTVAGSGNVGGELGDGGPATSAALPALSGLDVSNDGTLYVGDLYRGRVRAVDLSSKIITTAAGGGPPTADQGGSGPFGGDGGPARGAFLSSPSDVAVGASGALYIADEGSHRVRAVGDTAAAPRGRDSGTTDEPTASGAADQPTGQAGKEDAGGGDRSHIFLIGLLATLAVLLVAGIVLLRPRRGERDATAPPPNGQPWPGAPPAPPGPHLQPTGQPTGQPDVPGTPMPYGQSSQPSQPGATDQPGQPGPHMQPTGQPGAPGALYGQPSQPSQAGNASHPGEPSQASQPGEAGPPVAPHLRPGPPTVTQDYPPGRSSTPQEPPGPPPDQPGPPVSSPSPSPHPQPGGDRVMTARRLRWLAIGLGAAIAPFFVTAGYTRSESVNGVLVGYSHFDAFGVVAGIVGLVVAGMLARRLFAAESMVKWRLAAVALALVAVLHVLHATEILKSISPCTSDRPDNSWCRDE